MEMIKILIALHFVLLFLFFSSPVFVNASTGVSLFQITNDGIQQTSPFIYRNLVLYTSSSDIWGYNLKTEQNFPVTEKEGQQFLTGFYGNLVIYENTPPGGSTTDLWMYNLKTKKDTLVAGGEGSQTSGVTNGWVVVYIDGGACGKLSSYNIWSKITTKLVELTCHPVRIWQHVVFFPEADPEGTNIKGYNLLTNEAFNIASGDDFQEVPNIYQGTVVWLHRLSGSLGDYNAIKTKNLLTGIEKTIYESSTTTLNWPAISNRYVVWSESSANNIGGIKAADLKTGEVFEVQEQGPHQNSHTIPAIWKNTAVWMAWRTGNGDIYGAKFQRQ